MQLSSKFLQMDSDHRACLTCRTGEGYRAVYLMAYYGVVAIMFSKHDKRKLTIIRHLGLPHAPHSCNSRC